MRDVWEAMSDKTRREILVMLKERNLSAGEIAEKFSLTKATVSYHLSQLKKAELIVEEKKKNYIYYQLNTSVFEEIMMWIAQFSHQDDKDDEKEKP